MDRRSFIKSTAAAALSATGLLPRAVRADVSKTAVPGPQPNILLILVDELRFPRVFPGTIDSVPGFLYNFMPNVYTLWQSGVKFSGHHTAAVACTPAPGTLISGLYTQQSWLAQTITAAPTQAYPQQPPLNPAYPTYGRLLQQAGYQTPYIGKWHVSILDANVPGYGLKPYGFDGLLYPDPTGSNLQGTVGDPIQGYLSDKAIALKAVEWLSTKSRGPAPWCLTVSFVNPHDKEFFWAGTEFRTYNNLFNQQQPPFCFYSIPKYPPIVPWALNPLKEPPSFDYAAVPPNWESASHLAKHKPRAQIAARIFQEAVWGGVSDIPGERPFTIEPYPSDLVTMWIGKAPFSYWQRSLDSYTQIMQIVDERVGEVLDALPKDVANNTVIVFTSDHGEFAGAHGFVSGKLKTCYEEAYNVPLIVVDPSGRFTGELNQVREGLTSSVDMLRLLVSLGYNGSQQWLTGHLGALYGGRHNLIPMLQSANAPGRPYVLLTCDELAPGYYNFNNAPSHAIGLRTDSTKLGTYANWVPLTDRIRPESIEAEFYDYATPGGRLELDNLVDDERIAPALEMLLGSIINGELRAELPPYLRAPQAISKGAYLAYEALLANLPAPNSGSGFRPDLVGYGRDF
jgi:uncharacterized sulfatase